MIQDILTLFSVAAAFGYVLFNIVKLFTGSKQKKSGCSGCSACVPKQQHVFRLDKKINIPILRS